VVDAATEGSTVVAIVAPASLPAIVAVVAVATAVALAAAAPKCQTGRDMHNAAYKALSQQSSRQMCSNCNVIAKTVDGVMADTEGVAPVA
jgi:ABC-type phosphate transport system permease subunit